MNIDYCEKWFFAKSVPINPLKENDAKDRHDRGLQYSAVIGGFNRPSAIISFEGDWVVVSFLDDRGRYYLSYDFIKKCGGKMFLNAVKHRKFCNEGDKIICGSLYSFDENGRVIVEEQDRSNNGSVEREFQANVSLNWDSFPEFGQYHEILKKERCNPTGQP